MSADTARGLQDQPLAMRIFLLVAQLAALARATDTAPACQTGLEHGATRLTWTHADTEPNGRGTLAIWIRVAEADDRETLREDDNFTSEVTVEDETIDVCVEAANGGMRIVANLEKGDRIQLGGSDPTLEGAVLSVNGKDIGKEIWS